MNKYITYSYIVLTFVSEMKQSYYYYYGENNDF